MYRESAQRRRLAAVLAESAEHPTAAALHARLRREFQRLSLGTVYRNLDILATQGRVRVLPCEGQPTRYDGRLAPHAHFRCRACGRVLDAPLPRVLAGLMTWAGRAGHRVQDVAVDIRGTCADCGGRSPTSRGGKA